MPLASLTHAKKLRSILSGRIRLEAGRKANLKKRGGGMKDPITVISRTALGWQDITTTYTGEELRDTFRDEDTIVIQLLNKVDELETVNTAYVRDMDALMAENKDLEAVVASYREEIGELHDHITELSRENGESKADVKWQKEQIRQYIREVRAMEADKKALHSSYATVAATQEVEFKTRLAALALENERLTKRCEDAREIISELDSMSNRVAAWLEGKP